MIMDNSITSYFDLYNIYDFRIEIRTNSSNDLAEYIFAYGTLTKLKGE